MAVALVACFIQNANAADNADLESRAFKTIWQQFSELCGDAVDLATGERRDSKTALEFLTLREPKYVRLLKQAQDILGHSEAQEQFETIDELQLANKALEEKIVELKRKRISAPESSYNPLKDTKASIDKKLGEIPTELAENKAKIVSLQSEIIELLSKSGINLRIDELNYFLISAEGSELIRLMTIAENMKKIQRVIEKELEADRSNVGLAKVYTGMYLVSLDAYSNAHDVAIENILNYREKLKNISKEASKNYSDAQELKKTVAASDRANVEANININERTIEVAKMYDSLLQRRNQNLAESKAGLKSKIDLARNTYKIIVNGSSLITLVNHGSSEYALLVNFEMPELKTMYDSAMLSAFRDISEKIKLEK